MKKVVFALAMLFGGVGAANAQCGGTEVACANGTTINLSTSANFTGSHSVCLGNSICGSEGLRVKITVNGHQVYNTADWDYGDPAPTFNAAIGDEIVLTASSRRNDPSVICYWAGEITACIVGNF